MKKIIRLRKKLAVNILSLIMATGLLLLVVPFVAIASNAEDEPEAAENGTFSLFNGFFEATQVILDGESDEPVIITAGVTDAESYQWQVRSTDSEEYVDLPEETGISFAVSSVLAKQYADGAGKSFFRCLAVNAEGETLTSRVLTVLLPTEETEESGTSQTDETDPTISTIDITEPTQAGEGGDSESTTQPEETTTQPEESTTKPEETTTQPEESTTKTTVASNEETKPTQPKDDDSEEPQPPADDGNAILGELIQSLTGDEENVGGESEVIPEEVTEDITDDKSGDTFVDEKHSIEGILRRSLEPIRDAQVSYTVNYYIQKPAYKEDSEGNEINDDPSEYVFYKSETLQAAPDASVNLQDKTPGIEDDLKDYISLNTNISQVTGEVAADGSSEFNLYFTRETITLTIHRSYWSSVTSEIQIHDRRGKTHIVTGGTNGTPYLLKAKYGEEMKGLWPKMGVLEGTQTTMITGTTSRLQYLRRTGATGWNSNDNYYSGPVTMDKQFLDKGVREFDLYFQYAYVNYNKTANYYFQDADGTTPGTLKYVIKSNNREVFNSGATFEGFTFDYHNPTTIKNNTSRVDFYYRRNTYKLKYNTNGGTITVGGQTVTEKDVRYEEELDDLKYNLTPVRTVSGIEYEFMGWYKDAACTKEVNWGTDTMPMSSMTIYAKWKSPIITYTVNFYSEGTLIDTYENVESGATLTASDDVLSCQNEVVPHKTFIRWYYDSQDNEFVFGETTVEQNMDVYAYWETEKNNLIFANTNLPSVEIEYGKALSTGKPSDPVSSNHPSGTDHYNFVSWHSDEALSQPVDWTQTMGEDDVTVYAKWQGKPCTVRFYYWKAESGNDPFYDSAYTRYGEPVTGVADPNPYGEHINDAFKEWYYIDPDNGRTTFIVGVTPAADNMKVYGDWSPKYDVTFDPLNGDDTTSIKVVEDHTIASAPINPIKPGYSYNSVWYYLGENDVHVPFVFGDEGTKVTGPMTLYPEWIRDEIILIINNNSAGLNTFTVTRQGDASFKLTVAIAGNGQARIVHLPYDLYTVTNGRWDYRNVTGTSSQTADARNPEANLQEYNVSFGGSPRTLHWLGSDDSREKIFGAVSGS